MSNLFKQAHNLTRATIQPNDDYKATFTLCLRAIIADSKQPMANQFNTIFEAIGYKPARKPILKQAIATALPFTIVFMLVCMFMALVYGFHTVSANTADNRQHDRTMQTIEYVATLDDQKHSNLDAMFNNIQTAIDASGVQGVTIVYE